MNERKAGLSEKDAEDDVRTSVLAREAMARLYAAGDEWFVGLAVHGIVMMWIDERVIDERDPRLEIITNAIATLASDMEARRAAQGLDPTVVDPPTAGGAS